MVGVLDVSYSEARSRFAELLDRVNDDREVVCIHRPSGAAAVLLDADEYASLIQKAHLLSSPANARRLLQVLGELASAQETPILTAPEFLSRLGEACVKSWDETVRTLRRERQVLGSDEVTQRFRATLDDVLRSEVDELMTMMGIVHDDDDPLSPGANKRQLRGSRTQPPPHQR
jgi:antitoxin YefM